MDEKKYTKIGILVTIVIVAIILGIGGLIFSKVNKNNNMSEAEKIAKKENVKIRENEVRQLTLEDYSTDVFSMKKPTGWTVEGAGIGVFYAIRAYDPQNTNNQVFLMVKIQPLLKSDSAKSTWQNYYNLTGGNVQYKVFADAVVLNNPTTEGFYNKFGEITSYVNSIEPTLSSFKFPTFNNFTKQEEFDSTASMKSVALDSKVLRATFKGDNGKDGEGLFLASVVDFGSGQYQAGVDMSYYMVYDIMSVTSEKDKFIDYKDILLQTVNSINFTDSYVKTTIDNSNAQTQKALELSASIQRAFDSYMSAWENRSKSYDIMSQKQSDAMLGYERVYDTENGDIYKAYNGFTDDYDGERYKSISDNMYTEPTYGYIDK
jgi:hypothetical protein